MLDISQESQKAFEVYHNCICGEHLNMGLSWYLCSKCSHEGKETLGYFPGCLWERMCGNHYKQKYGEEKYQQALHA